MAFFELLGPQAIQLIHSPDLAKLIIAPTLEVVARKTIKSRATYLDKRRMIQDSSMNLMKSVKSEPTKTEQSQLTVFNSK
ncbi:hypothetical protein Godav_006471, partial [Gossypium davidsonii]|nr:hypothetical protein [Gossypium davidsonii]